MFKTIAILFILLTNPGIIYALDATSALAGYAVGKSGSGGRTVINSGNTEMGVIPFDCTLSSGKCLYVTGQSRDDHVPVKDVCGLIGPSYKNVGFKKVREYASSIIVLCKEVKTGCAKCH